MAKPISIFSAAKRLGEKSEWNLTHLQMQKMCYMAHMFYMGARAEQLIDSHFEAWDFGPVCPNLYHRLKVHGADCVPPDALAFARPVPDDHPGAEYLDAAVDQLPRNRLVAITHWENGAWLKNFEPYSRGIKIPNEDILAEYNLRQGNA